jgi:hypothetical protein
MKSQVQHLKEQVKKLRAQVKELSAPRPVLGLGDLAHFRLWAHLGSEHAGIWGIGLTFGELIREHDAEHAGPGTIRGHHEADRTFSLKKLGQVLAEGDA